MLSRTDLLIKIIKMEGSWKDLIKELDHFGWDSEKELAVVRTEDIMHILRRFINGELSDFDLEDWANIIESRDDIGFDNDLTKQYLGELANPFLTEKLTRDRAKVLIRKLSSSSFSPFIF